MLMLVMVIMMVTTISMVASQWNAGPECFSFKLQYSFADMNIFITTMVTDVVDILLTTCKAKSNGLAGLHGGWDATWTFR